MIPSHGLAPASAPRRRAVAAVILVCAVVGAVGAATPAGHADATSPTCPTPRVDEGYLVPGLPGQLVNAGTATHAIRARSTGTCGRAPDRTLRMWSADPIWFQAATARQLGASPVPEGRASAVREQASGTTSSWFAADVPASGDTWVGVRFRLADAAARLGLPVSQGPLLMTRIVVRTPPTIDPLPAVLPHDNKGTRLSGTAWPGDAVRVIDPALRVMCEATASADGRWTCAAADFTHGATTVRVSQRGSGARNPAYPGLTSQGLADQVSAPVTTRVLTADPAVLVEVDNTTPRVGAVVHYTVTALNLGLDTASGVRVTSALPAGVRHESSSATAGTYDPATGTWTGMGDLAAGQRQRLTIAARVLAHGPRALPATISADAATDGVGTTRLRGANGVPDFNTNPANDTDRVDVGTAPLSNPRLVKRADRRDYRIGDIVRYTLVATNDGPDTATEVSVHDQLPPSLVFVSARPNVGRFDAGRQRWSIGDLPTGVTARLTLLARVAGPGTIRNRATIEAAGSRRDASVSRHAADANVDVTDDASEAVITVRRTARG
ncbi:DUF11 domain-containing protein [Luedemannella helvata]|uniref:DUF11 domain-containing protein n=1 Tax=Luedemannella helvata TaxID=349315 RepID=A0ABN2L445_9ACTN